MTHKFDINNKSKLDNPKRREMLPVNKVLTEIGLNAEDRFADIGCGIGYFSIPAAEVVGTKGVVYALDVKEEMIEVLDEKIEENNLYNIRAIITDEYDFKLENKSVSYAFICTVFHEIEDRIKFLKETKRILIDGGRIAVIEWIKRESDLGPPVNHRLDSNDVKQELQNCGFKDLNYIELNEEFYIVMATL
jgi:ubiquinone/menaquinone biosynthesis C-methylase UbiE